MDGRKGRRKGRNNEEVRKEREAGILRLGYFCSKK
jgi:hypothetical protein